MLKSTIEFVNASTSDADYKGNGVKIFVPGLETVEAVVDFDIAADILADFAELYPAIDASITGTEDDGIDPPYQPYVQNKFDGDGAPGVNDDETEGYAPGSLWIDSTATPMEAYRCTDATEGAAVWLKTSLTVDELGELAITQNELDGDGAPGATDDATEGYSVGSVWVNATADPKVVYMCVDATEDAAVWILMSIVAGSIGTTAIQNGAVTSAKLANGAGVAALLAAGLGNSANYPKTTDGIQTLLAADALKARACLLVVTVTETFAAGDGAAPTFKIGEDNTDDKFKAVFNTGTAGDVIVLAGMNTSTKKVIVTATAATGTGAGGIAVTVLGLPTT